MKLFRPTFISFSSFFRGVSVDNVVVVVDVVVVAAAATALGLAARPCVLVSRVALAGEPQLAVVLLVVQHVHQVREHFSAVAAD